LLQILLLTTAEALVMVAGAVVVSSHTTSVRAANLLASFIIIPMAFLLMGETVLLFWGQYDVLWCIILGLIVTLLILTRTGTQTFNREEILAHEIDELNLGRTVRLFWHCFVGERFSLIRVYGRDLPQILKANALPIGVAVLVLAAGMVFGWIFALQHPLPREMIGTLQVSQEAFTRDLPSTGFEFLPRLDTTSIFWHNVQALVLEVLLGIFSFGSLALILLLAPMGIVGFATGEIALAGINPLVFLLAFILPHGLFELPAAILATALALRLGAAVMSPPRGLSVGENFIRALADLVKVFVFLILPLLLVAAFVEANITPQIVIYFFGR
jgi:uncharacterized membrane protein SpoIIM required for sporulation